LHVNHPRLEGLLVGVALAWLLARKDRHPLLRALSAPLKLVISILDLAWDQVVEFCGDLRDTLRGWKVRVVNFVVDNLRKWVKDPVMKCLRWVKEKLSRKEEKKED